VATGSITANRAFTLIGDRELVDAIKSLQKSSQNRVMRAAMKAGAAVVAREARQRAPRRSKLLSRSIASKSGVNRYGAFGVVYIKSKKANVPGKRTEVNPAKYAHLVEMGTRHHAARPFLRPALVAARPRAIEAIRIRAAERFAVEVGKARSRRR